MPPPTPLAVRQLMPAWPRIEARWRPIMVDVGRTTRDVLLAPLAAVLAVATQPALLAAATVLLVCVPPGDRDVTSVGITPGDLGSVALVAAASARVLAGGRLPRSRLWAMVAAAVVGCALATLASQDPVTSVAGFLRYLQLFVVVPIAVVIALRSRRDFVLVCASVIVAAVVEGAIGTRQYLTATGASFDGRNVRAVGTFGALDVMGMSTVVAYGLVVALGLALVLRGRARYGLVMVAALLTVPLLLSFSRGAIVATVGAIVVMLAAASPRLAVATAVFGSAAAIVALGVLGTPTGGVAQRVGTITSAVSAPDRSVSDRYELWRTAAGMWRDHPVTGVGPKRFADFRDSYAPLHLSSGSDVADQNLGFRREPLLSPHNMYLLVLSEQGLVGGAAFTGLLLSIGVAAWRRTRRVAGAGVPPDGRVRDGRLVSTAAVGVVAWTAFNFAYGDIGGPSTVLMSVLIGLSLWWAVQPPASHAGSTAA